MIQLFLRTAIAMAMAGALTLVIARVLMDSPPDTTVFRLLQGHSILLARTIADTPPAERRTRSAELSKVLGYPIQLEEAVGEPTPRTEWRAGSIFLIVRVPDTLGQMVLGPIPHGQVADLSPRLALSFVIAILAAFLFIRPIVGRIRTLESVAEKMCAGDFTHRAQRIEGDVLDIIATSLNHLADRIGQLLSDERDLLRTVAHEVRAPISRMRFRVEKIHRKANPESKKDSSGLITDLAQVDRLFEELLTYVAFDEFDRERPELQMTTIDVIDAISQVVEQVTATEEAIDVEVTGSQNAKIAANPKLFDRAVTNLLLNAIAYGGPNIRIEVREFEEECVVDVQDSGPGIPEPDRPKVIKPFVRLAKKKTKGTGLGLAIVSRIMKLHNGRLHLMNAPRGGASVQLVWKNAESKPRTRWPIGFFKGFTSSI